jgi:hypothetical protein
MTSETRYLCDVSSRTTVNNLLAFGLLTTNTTSGDDSVWSYTYIGIRVWIQHSDGSYTEVTSGTPVAQCNPNPLPTGTSHYSETWACPQTSMVSTDSVLVRVYGYSSPTWTELTDVNGYECDFQTGRLGASQLNSATWTVIYYFYHITYPAASYFEWGSSSFPTQIQNFGWTAYVPSYAPTTLGDGLSWIVSMTKKHHVVPWMKRFPKFTPRTVA